MIVGQNGNSKAHEGKIVQTEFLSKLSERIVIIPCAGFGTRVGSPPAKELLKHPNYGMTFLEKALLRVSEAGATPLVISRFDKTILNDWLKEHEIPHLLVLPTSEWVETVLVSRPFWQKKNLLLLPDADFSPDSLILEMLEALDKFELSFATFSVDDLSLWGGIKNDSELFVSEKLGDKVSGEAWGIIGWRNDSQEFWAIYEKARISKSWEKVPAIPKIFKLDFYEDLTRF